MRAPLSLPLLIAALLAASGCASTPPAPPASPPQSNPTSALQNCTPQSSLETSSTGAPASAGTPSTPAAPQPTSVPVPSQTAAQRRALIDKRLTDLRRSLSAAGTRALGGGDPPNSDGYTSRYPASLRLPDPRPAAKAGNGAMAREMPARSGDDIVARRLRKAAEQETDPGLKQKLWREYVDYRQNAQGK